MNKQILSIRATLQGGFMFYKGSVLNTAEDGSIQKKQPRQAAESVYE